MEFHDEHSDPGCDVGCSTSPFTDLTCINSSNKPHFLAATFLSPPPLPWQPKPCGRPMTTITLGAATDYRLQPVTHVKPLTFTNGTRGINTDMTASCIVVRLLLDLSDAQTAVTGSAGGKHLEAYLGADTYGALAFMTFANWGLSDSVSLFGTDAADILFGAVVDTRIDGGVGNNAVFGENSHDTLSGGLGNDTLNAVGGVTDGIDRLFLGPTVFSRPWQWTFRMAVAGGLWALSQCACTQLERRPVAKHNQKGEFDHSAPEISRPRRTRKKGADCAPDFCATLGHLRR